eukprot:jgi/Ulvmu1/10828/UM007_0002.1
MATPPSDDPTMNDTFSPLNNAGLDPLVHDEPSLAGSWLPSPLHQSPSPALPSLPSSPPMFPSPNNGNSPLPRFTEDGLRSRFDLSSQEHGRNALSSPQRHVHNSPGPFPTAAPLAATPVHAVPPRPATGHGMEPVKPAPNGTAPTPPPESVPGEQTKACGLCQEHLPIAEFRVNQRNTYGTYCLECNALRSRHKTLRVAQLRDMLAAGQISKSDVHAAVAAANPDYALPGDASLPATRECLICDFPKPITKFPAFGEAFAATDPPPPLGQPKRGLCCQKCDAAMRKAFHVPLQDLRSAASAGTLNDFMAIAVPRNPNLSRAADLIPCDICVAPRLVAEVKDIPADPADIVALARRREEAAAREGRGVAPGEGGHMGNGHAAVPAASGCVRACTGCRRVLRAWHGSLVELSTAITDGSVAVSHANPNNIPKAYRYARAPMDTPSISITLTEASALSQTCGQAFLSAIRAMPPASDVKPRLSALAAPPPAPRTASLSATAPLRPPAGAPAAVKRRRVMVDEEWDVPAQQQQDDDSSGPEGADGTKPCKLCRQRLKLEAFSRDGTGGCAYCGSCDHFRRVSTRHGVTMAQLRTLVQAGLGVTFLDELAARVLHSSRKVANSTRKHFNSCRTCFAAGAFKHPPPAATAILKQAFSEWSAGTAASSYRLAIDIDAIVATVYGDDVAAPIVAQAAGTARVSARPFPDSSAPAYYDAERPPQKRRAVPAANGNGWDIDMDIVAAAAESASLARCSFCERWLPLLDFPAGEGGERRCLECVALLRCAAQYSMSTAAVRSALHTGTLDLVLPDRPSHKGSAPPATRELAAAAPRSTPAAAPARPPQPPGRTADEVYDTYLVPEAEAAEAPQTLQRPANPRTPKLCGLCGETYRLGFYKWQGGTRWGYCAVCDRLRSRCSRAGVNVSGMRTAFERGTMAQVLVDKDVTWDPELDVVAAADVVEASWATAAVSMSGDDIPEFLTAVAEGRWGASAAAAAPVGPPGSDPMQPDGGGASGGCAPSGMAAPLQMQSCVYCGGPAGERAACEACAAAHQGHADAARAARSGYGGPPVSCAPKAAAPPAAAAHAPAPVQAPSSGGAVAAARPVELQAAAAPRRPHGGKSSGGGKGGSRSGQKPQRNRMCEVCCEQKGRSAFKTVTEERDDLPRDCCTECAHACELVAPMGLTWEDVQQAIETGTIIQLLEAAGYRPGMN